MTFLFQGDLTTGSDWTVDRDYRGDSKWPSNYHSYTATGGDTYGLAASVGTTYTGRDYNHLQYAEAGV